MDAFDYYEKVYVLFKGGKDGGIFGIYKTKEAALQDLAAHKKLIKSTNVLTVTEFVLRG
jgi:hypothetical protein